MVVPLGAVLRKGQALTLDRVRKQKVWLALGMVAVVVVEQRLHVVAIRLDHVPAKGTPLGGKVIQRHDLFGGAADLQPVAIHDRKEIVQMVIRASHGRFPDAALSLFAVAHDDVDVGVRAGAFGCQRHAHTHGQTVSQRAGADFHTRNLVVRVADQRAARLREGAQILLGEIAEVGEDGPVALDGMPFAEQEVVLRPFDVVKQAGEYVQAAHRPAGVPSAGAGDHRHRVGAALIGNALKFDRVHRSSPLTDCEAARRSSSAGWPAAGRSRLPPQ